MSRYALLSVLAASVLAACGGGGGGSGGYSPGPYAPIQTPPQSFEDSVQPQTNVPEPTGYSVEATSQFNRFNSIRAAAGLGMLRQNSNLSAAAQSHSDYISFHGASHYQNPSNSGFTGQWPADRARAAGYVEWSTTNEVITGDPWLVLPDANAFVDGLIATPYHRMVMFQYRVDSMGVGYRFRSIDDTPSGTGKNMVIKFGRSPGQGAPSTPFVIWPLDSATNVPRVGENEVPNPIPENNGAPYGYPISFQTHELKLLEVTNFTLRETAGGAVVPTKLLHYTTDCNLAVQQSPGCAAFGARYFASLLPREPLNSNTQYTARFEGTINGTSVAREWSFTTGSN